MTPYRHRDAVSVPIAVRKKLDSSCVWDRAKLIISTGIWRTWKMKYCF